MTYVSRRTGIAVPRWLDECDAEYRLRLTRKRSDGRLKKYSSAVDLRAWVNDNCLKHDYLVDLMSDGEISDKRPFRLYGRFIPVPILFQLMQKSETVEGEQNESYQDGINQRGSYCRDLNSANEKVDNCSQCPAVKSSHSGLDMASWEKNQLQKNLLDSTRLLYKAIQKLERINAIVTCDREQDTQEVYYKTKFSCSCSAISSSNNSECPTYTRSSQVKNTKDSTRFTELLRKISTLRAKLKKVQECRQEVNSMIRKSQKQRMECSSSPEVTEIFNRQEEVSLKKLHQKEEKLRGERGRLLTEMCNALTSLSNLRKSNFRKNLPVTRNDKTSRNQNVCGCKSCTKAESSDIGKTSGSSFATYNIERSNLPEKYRNKQRGSSNENNSKSTFKNCKFSGSKYSTCTSSLGGLSRSPEKRESKTRSKEKKSKLQYCTESPCQSKLYADDISAYQNSLTSQQQHVISGILQSIQQLRPRTSPKTKRELREANSHSKYQNKLERRAKSETTMKEIEKTLRNYECRLCDLDDLDHKVEEIKEKISESQCLRRILEKKRMEMQMQRQIDREKSEKEMTKLCSENWELKRQVEWLTVKFNAQTKKIQNLKCEVSRARDLGVNLECQAQELKKKLSEYQEGFEHQRKCICKWENVVAEQRTEIENLMNHIRMLTKMKEDVVQNNENGCVQKSRSYIQEVRHGKRSFNRPKTQGEGVHRDECSHCNCRSGYQHPFNGQMVQNVNYNAGYCLDGGRMM